MADNLIQVGAQVDLSELKQLVTQSDQVTASYQRLAEAQIQTNAASTMASDAMEQVSKKTVDVRHSIGLLDNTIRGAHGQAMADVIRLFGQSAFVMGALPIAATVAGFALLGSIVVEVAQKIAQQHLEIEKLTNDQTEFTTSVNTTFGNLDAKLLQAGIRADELSGDHLDKLRKQIQLIDHESLNDLIHVFGELEKASDKVFADLESKWYSFGIGSEGAKHALENFRVQYDSLLAQGKNTDATDLLKGTLQSAQQVLNMLKFVREDIYKQDAADPLERARKIHETYLKLQADGLTGTEKEYQAQQQLVKILQDQLTVEGKISDIKKVDINNAVTAANKEQIVDLTHLAEKHSVITALLRKQDQEAANIGLELARLWQEAGREAQKYLDILKTGYEGQIELARANEQATEAVLQAQLAKHKITQNQEVLAVRDAKLKELQEEQRYFQAIQALYAKGTKEWQEYQNKLDLIQAQAIKIRANAEAATAKATDSQYKSLFSSMGNSFKGFADSIIQGNQTIGQDFQQLYTSLILTSVNYLEQEAAQWLAHYLTKHLLHKADAASIITDDAAAGGASAYASVMASLPFPANVAAAPGVAASTSAAIEAFNAGLASFHIGSDFVPMDGIAKLQRGEKIIPAGQQGPGFSGGGNGLTVEFHVHAVDGQDGAAFINRQMGNITNNLMRQLKKKGFFPK